MAQRRSARSIDMEKALIDPGSVFATPEEVLNHTRLTRGQKIEILRRWEYDASEDSVAVEEGMPNGNGGLLQRVLLALERLASGIDMEQIAPTKQHGIPKSAVKPK